jgi:hypothetical protein
VFRRSAAAMLACLVLGTAACSSSDPSPAAAPAPGGGLPVTVENARYSWTVAKAETVATITDKDGNVRKPPGDAVAFLRLTMTVRNLTSSAQPYSVYDDHLTDAAGAPWAASGFVADGSYDATLPDFTPGEQRPVVELFPVDDGTKPTTAVLGAFDAKDGNGAKVPLG